MTDHGITDQVSQVTFTISTLFKRPVKINQSLAHNLRGIIGQVDLPGLHVGLDGGIWKRENTFDWALKKKTPVFCSRCLRSRQATTAFTSVCRMSSENTSRSHFVSKSMICEEQASVSLVTHQHQNQSCDEKRSLSFVFHWSWWMTVVTVWWCGGRFHQPTRGSLYRQDYPDRWLGVLSTIELNQSFTTAQKF